MLTLPSGDQICPRFNVEDFAFDLHIRQIQVIQRTLREVDVKLVVARPLTAAEEERVRGSVGETLQYDPEVRFLYVDEIPLAPSGKFEEFRSELDA